MTEVRFDNNGIYKDCYDLGASFVGRNGEARMQALQLTLKRRSVLLRPVTTKGKLANAWLELQADPRVLRELAGFLSQAAEQVEKGVRSEP